MKFRTKVSFLPLLIALIPFINLIVGLILSAFSEIIWRYTSLTDIFICIIVGCLSLWLLFSFTYTIDDDNLSINGFLYKKNIPIESIYKVEPVHNLVFDPASSSDRLQISFNKTDQIYISPKNTDLFIQTLTKANSKIIIKK